MLKTKSGFTIVELLIVIVIIGILAAITIVAYNGIQDRARNNKTITAVAAWAKALKLYSVDRGFWPTSAVCLGTVATYDSDGKCWAGGPWQVQQNFNDTLSQYFGGTAPEPDSAWINNNSIRGARYYYGPSPAIYWALNGVKSCPQVGGISLNYQSAYSNSVQCGGTIN